MRFFVLFVFFLFSNLLFAESTEKLLAGYLENDLQLKKTAITAESKILSLKKSKINNGINISLSTGEMKITTSSDKKKITVTPSATVTDPLLNDLSVGASFPVVIEDGEKEISGGKLTASVGIISNARKKSQIEILEAQRNLLVAERNLKNSAISAEKEFYNNLKALYKDAVAVLTARAELYDDTTDLKVLQVQGYSKTSASYRQKNLKVESDKRNVLEKQRIFERETAVFAKKCGIEFNRIDVPIKKSEPSEIKIKESIEDRIKLGEKAYKNALEFLPIEIPSCPDERIFDYDKNLYTKTEQALWDKYIGDLKRKANGELSLKFSGEYIFNDSFYSSTKNDNGNITGLSYGSDSVGGKLSLGWRGVTASAGAYFPTKSTMLNDKSNDKTFYPYYSLSLTIVPNDWRLASISKNQEKLDSKLEDIAIESALDDYETSVLDTVSKFHDLKWSERSNKEELETYIALEKDMSRWLSQGIVTENNYLDTVNNKEKARINVLTNAIDLLIFNADVKLMFVEKKIDAGEKNEKK